MRVVLIASTLFHDAAAESCGWVPFPEGDQTTSLDKLGEAGGRNCYQAWERKRPETATNQGYLNNIISQGHFSVLEHGSVTFFVDGVSRSLTHELIRHRHLSFSELSQRYVNMEDARFVMPPALRELGLENDPERTVEDMTEQFQGEPEFGSAKLVYDEVVDDLEAHGLPRKRAREAARAFLPNATETKIVCTGNLRAWRDVLHKRYHVAADAEIRELATLVLGHLRKLAPNSVQDIPDSPYGSR